MKEQQRILIVSHDPTSKLVDILETSLSNFGYNIMSTTQTGPGLESVIMELMPHMVVVDFSLSYLEGIRLSLEVRQWSPIPVLVLTTNSSKPNAVSTLALNHSDYLSDPLDMSALSVLVENILDPQMAQPSKSRSVA